MKLEELKLWRERELMSEEIPREYGFLGAIYGVFRDGTVDCGTEFPSGFGRDIQCEFGRLVSFLQCEGKCFLKDHGRMSDYCRSHPHARVPYKFNRECWGFRVLTNKYAWYIACTPWNDGRHFTVYCYDREVLMSSLAGEKGLVSECFGILPFTGELIVIRFGEDGYSLCAEKGATIEENKILAMAQNGMYGINRAQISAMVNGAIYGWDTPLADPENYDDNGYLRTYGDKTEKGVR